MAQPVVYQRDTAGWFRHPRGLSTLFFTEMWERFSFYGLKALLILFMTASVAQGGLGFTAERGGGVLGWGRVGGVAAPGLRGLGPGSHLGAVSQCARRRDHHRARTF